MFLIHGPKGLNGWFVIVEAATIRGAKSKFREASGMGNPEEWTVRRLKPNEHDILLSRLV